MRLTEARSLEGLILVSSPDIQDPRFSKTLVFLFQHDDRGAHGIIVNRPFFHNGQMVPQRPLTVEEGQEIWPEVPEVPEIPQNMPQTPPAPANVAGTQPNMDPEVLDIQSKMYMGGPLESGKGLVLHRPGTQRPDIAEGEQFCVTTADDYLVKNTLSDNTLMAMGYAAWDPGLLEEEINQNIWWLTVPNNQLLFQAPAAKRWEAALQQIGINTPCPAVQVGHA